MSAATVTRDQRRQQLNGETLFALAGMATEAGIPNADLLGFSDLVEALLDRPPVPAGPAPTGGRRFSKPQPARRLEARARARTLGVRVAVVVEARRYCTHSQSEPGTVHTCERTPVGWACSCLSFEHTGMCKYLGAVERRSEREGWRFGQVAPLATVARYMPLDPAPARRASQDDRPARGGQDDASSVVAVPTADSQSARAARTRAALADLYGDAA